MYRYKIRYNLKETENELRENLVQLYQKLIEKNDPVFFAAQSDKVLVGVTLEERIIQGIIIVVS
jgi:hypothetical protein